MEIAKGEETMSDEMWETVIEFMGASEERLRKSLKRILKNLKEIEKAKNSLKEWLDNEVDDLKKKRKKELSRLIDLYYEEVKPLILPTDDEERIHAMYESLPQKLRKKMKFCTTEPGKTISVEEISEMTGMSKDKIDRELRKAGFTRWSKMQSNGTEIVGYKIPIDKLMLLEEKKKKERERREWIEKIRRIRDAELI